nr:YTH domain-containing protein 1 [Ipomoea batatas]
MEPAVRELAEFELKVKKKKMSSGGGKKGSPKHQNRFAWKPNAGKDLSEIEAEKKALEEVHVYS